MTKNFVNFHVLISHNPSCLNRDDMNMQKSATFGGKRRVRISSQSLKRAMRKSPYYSEHLGEASIRTKHLANSPDNPSLKNVLLARLAGKFEPELIVKTLTLLSAKDIAAQTAVDGDAVAPWAVDEFTWFCNQVKEAEEKQLDEKALVKKLKGQMEPMRRALIGGIDIALSGRMATSGLLSELGKVDGALAMAHAITTHTVDADIDWFTAVDDLQELGSGHLDTQEFSSGVFYRYASLNLGQLQENLGNATRKHVLEVAAHVAHLMATVVPTAKQQSFAAHNLADLAMVSFSDIPVSLANAFEEPVKAAPGFLKPSTRALHEYWQLVHAGYGLNEECAQFSLGHTPPEDISHMKTLEELKAWIQTDRKVKS